MSPPWRRRETPDLTEDRVALAVERRTAKQILHQASDLVLEIRVAAERMEEIIKELAEEEGDERRGPDVADGGPPPPG